MDHIHFYRVVEYVDFEFLRHCFQTSFISRHFDAEPNGRIKVLFGGSEDAVGFKGSSAGCCDDCQARQDRHNYSDTGRAGLPGAILFNSLRSLLCV
jgi:hypothetical protein